MRSLGYTRSRPDCSRLLKTRGHCYYEAEASWNGGLSAWSNRTPLSNARPYMKPLYLTRQTAEWTWLIIVMKSNTGRSVTFWMAAA